MKVLERGDHGQEVGDLQRHLSEVLGVEFDSHGSFGPKTEATVKSFQQINHLPVTGVVDPSTQSALNKQLKTDKEKSKKEKTQNRQADDQISQAIDLLKQATKLLQGVDKK